MGVAVLVVIRYPGAPGLLDLFLRGAKFAVGLKFGSFVRGVGDAVHDKKGL